MDFYYDYDSLLNILGGGVIFLIVLVFSIIVLGLIAYWKFYKKAGRKGWESLIPIYSYWVLIEISGLNWWWFLLLAIDIIFKVDIEGLTFAISICSFLGSFNCYYNIARRFGKDKTTSIFAGIFPLIFVFIVAFSKNAVFDASIPVNINGIFDTVNDNMGNNNHMNQNNIQDNNYEVNQSTTTVDSNKDVNCNTDNSDLQEYSYCGDCGMKLNKDVKFCPNCGRKK